MAIIPSDRITHAVCKHTTEDEKKKTENIDLHSIQGKLILNEMIVIRSHLIRVESLKSGLRLSYASNVGKEIAIIFVLEFLSGIFGMIGDSQKRILSDHILYRKKLD